MASGSVEKVRSYRDLEVWQRARALAVDVYRITETFPRRELYGLTSQIRRAAVSFASNIAEGHVRRSDRVLANHLDIALGSAAELSTQLEIAAEVGCLDTEPCQALEAELEEITKMLFGLLRVVRGRR